MVLPHKFYADFVVFDQVIPEIQAKNFTQNHPEQILLNNPSFFSCKPLRNSYFLLDCANINQPFIQWQ